MELLDGFGWIWMDLDGFGRGIFSPRISRMGTDGFGVEFSTTDYTDF
jgi:hypothetical protein